MSWQDYKTKNNISSSINFHLKISPFYGTIKEKNGGKDG